jgi:hypothetical protein
MPPVPAPADPPALEPPVVALPLPPVPLPDVPPVVDPPLPPLTLPRPPMGAEKKLSRPDSLHALATTSGTTTTALRKACRVALLSFFMRSR